MAWGLISNQPGAYHMTYIPKGTKPEEWQALVKARKERNRQEYEQRIQQ